MPQKGRRYENDTAVEFHRESPDHATAWPIGYSGSNAIPSADVLLLSKGGAVALELKTTSQDTFGVAESDLEQLLDVQKNYMDICLVINFANREPVFIEPAFPSLDGFGLDGGPDPIENFMSGTPDVFEPRRTDGGDEPMFRVSKPSTDEWPSARSGKDTVEKLIDEYV